MGIALPQLAPASEDRVSGVQIVDGSLRFDKSKTQRLVRTPSSAGNRRTWTWSGWVKRNNLSTSVLGHTLFQRGDTYIYFAESANIDNIGVNLRNAATNYWAMSSAVYRDVSGWYHIVVAIDTTLSNANDRVKIWINNSLITAFSISSYTSIGQNYEPLINSAAEHGIGGTGGNLDAQLSNVYFIDGQALGPEYFGYTDPLTNTWRPKRLDITKTPGGSYGTNGFYLPFDGNSPIGQDQSGRGNNWTPVKFGGSNTLEKATGALPILNTDGGGKVARVGTRSEVSSSTPTAVQGAVAFDGSGDYLNTSVSSSDFTFGTGDFTVEGWFYQLDTTERGVFQISDTAGGLKATATGVISLQYNSGESRYKIYAGGVSTGGAANGRITGWVHFAVVRNSGTTKLYLNGSEHISVSDSTNYSTTYLCIGGYYSTSYLWNGFISNFRIIKGTALYTSNFTPPTQQLTAVTNTKLLCCQSSTSATAAAVSPGSITANGDAFATKNELTWSNVLALPLVGNKDDVSNLVSGRSSAKTITANGSASSSNTTSNFYGGSFNFGTAAGSAVYPNATSSDFAFGTGDFTVEFWFYSTATSRKYLGDFRSNGAGGSSAAVGPFIIWADTGSDGTGTWIRYGNNSSSPNFDLLGGRGLPPINTWHHLAIVRKNNTVSGYLNGVLTNSTTDSTNYSTNTSFAFGNAANNTVNFSGYLQDLRIYKGLAKYTSNFIPASTDPDILPDTPSGVSGSSKLTQITDGAVAFDGTDDYLTVANNGDFDFGSGDFTLECFVYPQNISREERIFYLSSGTNQEFLLGNSSGNLFFAAYNSSGGNLGQPTTSSKLILNSWNHIAVVRNGATLSIYLNGVSAATANYSTNTIRSGETPLYIGHDPLTAGRNFTGFISNVQVVKGTALYTSNFTPPTGPLTSTENTKLLCCKSNSSATAFDVSPGTITSVNALATNFNPFTANINAVRGQESGYCTFNPLDKDSGNTVLNGNLTVNTSSAGQGFQRATMYVSSGKWYWEITVTDISNNASIGIAGPSTIANTTNYIGATADSYGYVASNGNKYNNSASASYGATYTSNDVIGVALDLDAGTLIFYKNGVSQGTAYSSLSGSFSPAVSDVSNSGGSVIVANFGQKPFKFPPPTGFQPLALANTPRPTIVRPDQYVGIVTYTGNGSTQSLNVGFKPDFVWIKNRTDASTNNSLFDSVRGVGISTANSRRLSSDNTTSEWTSGDQYGYLSSFDTYGFSVSKGTTTPDNTNGSTKNYVAWAWKAGHPTPPTSGAVAFDGTGDYLSLASSADFQLWNSTSWTIEGWIYLNSLTGANFLGIGNRASTTTRCLFAFNSSTGNFVLDWDGTTSDTSKTFSFGATTGRWYHFAVVSDGTTARVYKDGVQLPESATLGTSTQSNAPLFVGVYGTGSNPASYNGLNGYLSNFRIIKGTALYTSNFTPSTSPLTNVTNTKLLCCQSTTSATAATVTPGTITANGNATATSYNPFDTFSVDGTGYSTASAAGLTAGTITPTGASVNTKSGFSIITYTGQTASGSISHGLGQEPKFIITKVRSGGAQSWGVYHKDVGINNYLLLDSTGASTSYSGIWGSSTPTSTVLNLPGNVGLNNYNTWTYVAYLWSEIPGFSKFGKWTGGSDTFVYLGFRPRWLMVKANTAGYEWLIFDSERSTYNLVDDWLVANTTAAEVTSNATNNLDFLSNGFKIKGAGGYFGTSNDILYAAFAEAPTFNLYGAQSNAR